ncbi:hypothetical protein [Finegoldia magna]|nr:hypothetical protein [Finegoldia magna]MDU5508193.1 hypothetical protein [Finegoldia magna]
MDYPERINTFPDDWTKGNALVVDLIKEIGGEILKIINDDIYLFY